MKRELALIVCTVITLVSSGARAVPVKASGTFTIDIGVLPPVSFPIPMRTVDLTGGTLTVPAGTASMTGLFIPVTGFPANLITGIVVTVANDVGSFWAPSPFFHRNGPSVPGDGFGGRMPLVGIAQTKGPLALNVPLSIVGAGGSRFTQSLWVQGAPWTTRQAKVTTTGAQMLRFVSTGTQAGSLGDPTSTVTLVSPTHINIVGLQRVWIFTSTSLHFVPEPGTALLVGVGLAVLAGLAHARPPP